MVMRGANLKPKLETIAVFGANNKIGLPLARYVVTHGDAKLRLVVRAESHKPSLAQEFPNAEIVVANYYDLPSLEAALNGANGVFVVTPDFLDEERAMTNFVYAARQTRGLIHIVRLLADPPGMSLDRVPEALRRFGGGTAVQHLRAKAVLGASGLPITYINIASYFMQNFATHLFNAPLRAARTFACPRNRRMGFIDTVDIGACAAALLLSTNHRHLGQTYHLDNGYDVHWFDEVAEIMSRAWDTPIAYDGSDETYLRWAQEGMNAYFGRSDAADYFLAYGQFEQDNETVWRKTDIVEYLTGRPGKRLAAWLAENKTAILGE